MTQPVKVVLKTDVHFGHQLRRLFWEEMVELSLWQPKVQCIFTIGKDNMHWRAVYKDQAVGSSASGVVVEADIASQKDEYHGTFLVDLRQIAKGNLSLSSVTDPSGRSRMRTNRRSFDDFKREVIKIMAHEYYHLIQHWRVGEDKFAQQYRKSYDQIRSAMRKKLGDRASDDSLDAAAHGKHPFEQSAEQIAQERVRRFRRIIDKGLWDSILPMDLLRTAYAMSGGGRAP